MDEKLQIQAAILADTDAAFLPNRKWDGHRIANVYFARLNYRKHGVPWHSGGATEADRKAVQRNLDDLHSAGAVEVFRPHRVKALGVRLSHTAEEATRRALGLATLHTGRLLALELSRRSMPQEVATMLTDTWVCERALFPEGKDGPADYANEAWALEDRIMPALVRGYVDSNSNWHGLVYYALTPAGWKWLDTAAVDEPESETWNEEALGFYFKRRQANRNRYRTAEPERRGELGEIPLPASMVGQAIHPTSPHK